MRNYKNILTYSVSIFLASCGVLPIESEIKENHFRFENFKQDIKSPSELVYLMCYRKRPTSWAQPKQYLGGEHELWVEANISDSPINNEEAFVFFKVKLDSGKSYMLNRKIEDKKISIWIQESESDVKVSEVITTDLKIAALGKRSFRKKRCKTGSI